MNDLASLDEWTEHRIWLRVHEGRKRQRLQWTGQDWDLARQVADTRWERNPDTYLWEALKGVEQAHWCHARRFLAKA